MSTKAEYIEKYQTEIEKWNTEIDVLEAKIIEADAKSAHEEQINALRQHRDEAKAKLAEIQAAHEDKWEELKDGLEHTWTTIKDGFEKFAAKFQP
ncbi:hypothetical protein U14_04303 [Candidatus Moduliflexus flocculans]|uniref:Coiled coil domain-containing protein n=1 Tax=Candidatus Moduliflexus flocculans TaxID=1499966 RepID=A0A0S6W3V9_9BACT|nr:hypothetical protein U14_04303 [Candidatus Moduliflexus flocculans]